jgi:hypothetical protein
MLNVKTLPQIYWAAWLADHTRTVGTFHRLEKNCFFSLWIVYSFGYTALHTEAAQLSKINEVLQVLFFRLMNSNLNFKILLVSVTGLFGGILQTGKISTQIHLLLIFKHILYTHLNIILLSFFPIFQVTIPRILSPKFYIQFCLSHPILCEASFITVTIIGHFYHPQSPVLHKLLYSPLRIISE